MAMPIKSGICPGQGWVPPTAGPPGQHLLLPLQPDLVRQPQHAGQRARRLQAGGQGPLQVLQRRAAHPQQVLHNGSLWGWGGGVGATRRGTWARMTAGMFICNPSRFHTTNPPIMTLYHRIMTVITHKSGTQNAQKRLNPIVHSGGSHWTLGGKVEMETFSFETQNLSLQFIFDLLV